MPRTRKTRPDRHTDDAAGDDRGEGGAPFVSVEDVHLAFGEKKVLTGLSLEIRRGDTISIFGESGSGKTVLLRVMLGLQKPDRGRVRLFGTDIADLSDEQMEPVRRRISVVYQAGALYSALTVAENIALELKEVLELPKKEIEQRIRESLDAVGLSDVDPDLLPDELSGGMKKRLAVARAIAPHPEMIFYDEPTSGLDPINSARILTLIRELHDQMGATSVVVTHDLKGASAISNRVVLIADGKAAFDGTPDAFLTTKQENVVAFRAAAPSFADFGSASRPANAASGSRPPRPDGGRSPARGSRNRDVVS